MQRRTVVGWVAGVTLIGACGIWLSPQYQLWQWMQRYSSVSDARAALRQDPNDAKAHLTLAWTMLSSETAGQEVQGVSASEARHEWEEVIRCSPSNEVAVCMAIPILIRQGNTRQREQFIELLRPIAAHGNAYTRPEAEKMLMDLGGTKAL